MPRTVFVVLPVAHGDILESEDLERLLKLMLRRREVACKTRSYWDDAEYETEYGVRLDIESVMHDEDFQRLLG